MFLIFIRTLIYFVVYIVLLLKIAKENIYSSDGSKAVPARPSLKGRLEIKDTEITSHTCIHIYRFYFQFVPHGEHSVLPSEKPIDFFENSKDHEHTVWQNA